MPCSSHSSLFDHANSTGGGVHRAINFRFFPLLFVCVYIFYEDFGSSVSIVTRKRDGQQMKCGSIFYTYLLCGAESFLRS
jgi:hypothetical protein